MEHSETEAGFQPEGINANALLLMVLGMVAMLGVAAAVGAQIAFSEFSQARSAATEVTGYPALRETRSASQALLTRTEVIDAEAGVYRIPIDRAMALIVAERHGPATSEVTLTR
jgi:hypothetical protein